MQKIDFSKDFIQEKNLEQSIPFFPMG